MKYLFLTLLLCTSTLVFSQTTVCEGSPCTAKDFNINTIFLGDADGVPLGNGICDPGEIIEAHLWVDFTANTAAARYSLFLHFNLYYNGVFIQTIEDCYFNLQSIPLNVLLDTGVINWECGTTVSITDLYMSWQTNDAAECACSRAKCISEDIIVVQTPLIANFEYTTDCSTPFQAIFTSTTTGGVPPFTYLWDFGDGNTSTLENPTHNYNNQGPFTATLTVTDDNGTDFISSQIITFDTGDDRPLILTPPSNLSFTGCDTSVITPYNYSETPVTITIEDFIIMDGSIEHYATLVNLTYVDMVSGTCPIQVTRTFNAEDRCGTTATATQLIEIIDNIPPTANSLDNITLQCRDDIPSSEPSLLNAQDNCALKSITFNDVSDQQTCPETITRTYLILDQCDNATRVNQTIIINDTIAPVLLSPLEPNVSIGCGMIPEAPELEFSDNCPESLNVNYTETTFPINSSSYTIIRTWTVSDHCNQEEFTQEVFVSEEGANELISREMCIDDEAIDLNTLISNTNILTGTWTSENPDILDGSIFNPGNVEAGSYEFTYNYISDASCVFKTVINVGLNEDCIECVKASTEAINISKLVTPNNDGRNDFFEVRYDIKNSNARLCAFSISLDIYNRWGTKVYSNANYDNSWQGNSPENSIGFSEKLPTGTYYYIIRFNNTEEKTNPIQGYILLGSN